VRRLLVLQHVAHEILGTLDPLLRAACCRIRYVNFGREPDARPDPARYDGLIVLGGPMNCDQVERHRHLALEVECIREAIRRGRPALGICLGSQLIARGRSSRVHTGPGPGRRGAPATGAADRRTERTRMLARIVNSREI
jgi:GMP synthase (glutamine-hydrolysing)